MHDVKPIIALFEGFLSGWEIMLVITVLFLSVSIRTDFWDGVRKGLFEFGKSGKGVLAELDKAAHGAGRSVGGIHGKIAAEALTTGNETKEFYDPPQLRKWSKSEGLRRRFINGVIRFLKRAAAGPEGRIWRAN